MAFTLQTKKVGKLVPSKVKLASHHNTVICNMADLFSAATLTENSEIEEENKQKAVEKFKMQTRGRNPVCLQAPPFSIVCF